MYQQALYLFIIFTITNFSTYAQNTTAKSREYTAINKLEKSHHKKKEDFNYYGASKLLDSALNISIAAGYSRKTGRLYNLKGQLLYEIKEYKQAIDFLDKAVKIQYKFNDKKNLGRSYKVYGDIYKAQKKYNKALDAYNTAEVQFRQKKMDKNLADVLHNSGMVHLTYNNFSKAKELLEESVKFSKNHPKTLCRSLVGLANINNDTGNTNKASEYANKALKIAKKNNCKWEIISAYKCLGDINTTLKNYKKANFYYNKHITTSHKLRSIKETNIKIHKRDKAVIENQTVKLKEAAKELDKEKDKNFFSALISVLSVSLIVILSLLTLSLYKNNNMRLKSNNMLHKTNLELTQAKERAELASQTKANFLSTVTHELRTPLYAVTGLSSMLLDENPRPEQIQHLKSLKFSGDYLLTFINDILQINKIEAKKVDIEEEQFDRKLY